MTNPLDYANQNQERFLNELKHLISIPSISTQPEHTSDVLQVANWIRDKMLSMGMSKADLIHMPEGRHPCVLGEWLDAGENVATILIYCHYDVQPAEIEDGWQTPPFEPTEHDDKLYGRGAVDSKLHVIAQLNAIESLLKTDSLSVNVKVLCEGEEESGSETINAFIGQQPERLKADIAVISDGCIMKGQPTLVYGLRGIVTMELHVYGPQKDLHSGHFGGSTHNPIQALAEIIAQLHDESGFITVPNFYEDVVVLDTDERESLEAVNQYTEAEWRDVANSPNPYGEPDYTMHERVGARPTLEINGIKGGYAGSGFKTVLPSHAMAKISCRLVTNQNPSVIYEILKKHIEQITPSSVRSELIQLETGASAILLDRESVAMQAGKIAYEAGWGTKPIFERAGGSVPITYELQKIADDMVIMGFGYRSGTAHGPNEHIFIDQLYNGIQSAITFLQEIGKHYDQ